MNISIQKKEIDLKLIAKLCKKIKKTISFGFEKVGQLTCKIKDSRNQLP